MAGQLRIVAHNVNGLLTNKNDVENFLNVEKIDILLLSETHLLPEQYFSVLNYDFYRSDHPSENSWGGAGLLIRSHLKHYLGLQRVSPSIQAVGVVVDTKNGPVHIASIYSPPRHNIKKDEYESFFSELGPRFILGGDFNAKNTRWGSRLNTTKGRQLLLAGFERGCDFHSDGKPTFWPSDPAKKPDVIDFWVTKNFSRDVLEVGSIDDYVDHSPIILVLHDAALKKTVNQSLTNDKTDWEKFRDMLKSKIKIKAIASVEALEEEVKVLTENIREAAIVATPPRIITYREFRIPQEILELVRERRRARKRWKRTRFPGDKAEFNRCNSLLTSKLREIKHNRTKNFLKGLTPGQNTDYSLWKSVKYLKRNVVHSPPIKKPDGSWAKTATDKAETFSLFLQEAFTPNPESKFEDEKIDFKKEFEKTSRCEPVPMRAVTPDEVLELIKYKIKRKKAPGKDQITGEILKQLPGVAIAKLATIFSAAMSLTHVPAGWKEAEVIVIPKAGKPPHEVSSYRPISLLPVIGKLFERVYLKRLLPLVEERGIIPDHQFGFRSRHSTIEQVNRVVNVIEDALEGRKVCSCVFLDVSQAFDRVFHESLLFTFYKLLPVNHFRLLESYLADRKFKVRYEDARSTLKAISAGVPQGSVLGPILYLIFTHDIPLTPDTTLGTFADDTVTMAVGNSVHEANTKVQRSLDGIFRWTRKKRVVLNNLKSQHVLFTNRKYRFEPVFLGLKPVPPSKSAKYLGLTLDTRLRWKEHVKIKLKQLKLKHKRMLWLLGSRSSLLLDNKILLYKSILRPVWSYGCQLWGCTADSNIKLIQTFQNKVLRQMSGAPWYIRNTDIHADLGIEPVRDYILKTAENYERRLDYHPNAEALSLLVSSETPRRLKRRKPLDLVAVL